MTFSTPLYPVDYMLIMKEGPCNLLTPIFHHSCSWRASNFLALNLHPNLFKGKLTVHEIIIGNGSDEYQFRKLLCEDFDFLSQSELVPLLLVILVGRYSVVDRPKGIRQYLVFETS